MPTCKKCLHYEVCQFHIDEETKMTVNECEQSPVMIDYYFGDYDKEATDSYIERFLKNQEHLKNAVKYLESKYMVDYDSMTVPERLKFDETVKAIKEMITTII